MRAVTWHGTEDVRVDNVPDPRIEEPTDAIVRITSTAICGSDLHLYKVLGPFIDFTVSCGSCWMCERELFGQCETTQVRSTTAAPRSSATRSCTGRYPAGRPNTCGCGWPTSDP